MFKNALFGLAGVMLASTATAIDTSERAELACYLYDDYTVFDLRPLEKKDGGHHYTVGKLNFNFCEYVDPVKDQDSTKDTFAYYFDDISKTYIGLTDDDIVTTNVKTLLDDESNVTGVQFTQDSQNVCKKATED